VKFLSPVTTPFGLHSVKLSPGEDEVLEGENKEFLNAGIIAGTLPVSGP
jgi:hypothetical protein